MESFLLPLLVRTNLNRTEKINLPALIFNCKSNQKAKQLLILSCTSQKNESVNFEMRLRFYG